MLALALVLSLGIGLSLGLLGGGGSILTVSMLVYVLGMDEKQAIPMSLVVVGATSVAGLVPHLRQGNVDWRAGLLFAGAGMVGAVGGGLLAALFSGKALMLLFTVMMLATAGAMLRGRRTADGPGVPAASWKIGAYGLAIGFGTGLVGAGGGFLVVPALVLLGGLPIRKAIGTSLLVIAANSLAGYLGHATHSHLDLALTAGIAASAVVGAVAGSALSVKVNPDALRKGFGVLVLALGVFQLYQELT